MGKRRRSGTALDYGQVGDIAERPAPRNLELDLNRILAVDRLFNTPWFTHLWVVQEVCLWTKSQPWVVCGPFRICFASIMDAHRLLCNIPVMLPIGPEDPFFGGKSLSMDATLPRTIETVRKFYGLSNFSDSQELGIHQCLADAWELKCTDPRDKVYGLLGLVRSKYTVLDQLENNDNAQKYVVKARGQQWIKIDYEAEYQNIYEARSPSFSRRGRLTRTVNRCWTRTFAEHVIAIMGT
jgi:hypothetical protein